jgi:hypothetical protein
MNAALKSLLATRRCWRRSATNSSSSSFTSCLGTRRAAQPWVPGSWIEMPPLR